MGEDHRLTALLSETEAAGIKLRAQGGQLHITAPKTATHTARLVALAKAAVLARLGGRPLPDGACYRCGIQPGYLVTTYWQFPICPGCCRQLAEPSGEFDQAGTWPQMPDTRAGVSDTGTGCLTLPDPVSRSTRPLQGEPR